MTKLITISIVILSLILMTIAIWGGVNYIHYFTTPIIEELITKDYYDNYITSNTIKGYNLQDLMKATVFIKGDNGSGSGFVVKATEKYIYILTCYHVYKSIIEPEDCDKEIVFARNVYEQTIRNKIKLIKSNGKLDIALLQIPNVIKGFKVAKIASKELLLNEDVMGIGSPLGVVNFISRGYLGTTYYKGVTIFNMHATFGNSGSAVFNMRGEVVGLMKQVRVIHFLDTCQYIAICVTRKQIKGFLEKQRYE